MTQPLTDASEEVLQIYGQQSNINSPLSTSYSHPPSYELSLMAFTQYYMSSYVSL